LPAIVRSRENADDNRYHRRRKPATIDHMHLVQLLLPLYDNAGQRFDETPFAAVRQELTHRFGGVTAYMRSPATGLWKKNAGNVDRDEVVTVEVMVDHLDRDWWRDYCRRLARSFHQDSLVVRAIAIDTF
jgi:hypothetical protein